MLTSLSLEHFQAHHKRRFDLPSAIVSIVGPSEQGKSSILRAIRLICLGEWDSGYVRHGEENCFVSLTIDGRVIKRKKGKVNLLKLDGHEKKAFGKEMPEEVARLLNVSELNFQRQLDPHFWFSDTAGEVSKQLNKIVNLEVIDKAHARVNFDLKQAKAELSVTESRIKEAKAEVEGLAWVPKFKKDVAHLNKLQLDLDKSTARRARLANCKKPQTTPLTGKRTCGTRRNSPCSSYGLPCCGRKT